MKYLIKHMKSSMSFLRNNKSKIKFVSEIIASFASVVSAIIVVLTLNEMQIQRNNAYMPDVVFEPVTVNVSWGDPAELDDSISRTGDVPETNPTLVRIPVRNIGVGVAKKLTFTIDADNYFSWISEFNELNPDTPYTYKQNGDLLIISNGSLHNEFNATYHNEKTFLLPNAEETYEITLPIQYTKLLHHFYETQRGQPFTVSDLEINVSFEDVQGIKYDKVISLTIQPSFSFCDANGNGLAAYEISMR